MAKKSKTYTCFRWPNYVIGSHSGIRVQFNRGQFTTDDPAVQKFIEGNESFGAQIRLAEPVAPRGTLDDEESQESEEAPDNPTKAHVGSVGSGGMR